MSDDEGAGFESMVAEDPAHPIHKAALDRTGSLGRTWVSPAGASVTFADLPLVVASGDAEACVGVLSFGWEGEHEVTPPRRPCSSRWRTSRRPRSPRSARSSMATERAEWFERVAHTDPLTGLSNGRTLGRVLELEVARAQRQGSEVSVAMFDVDGFTALNEASGSRAGDQVLRQVAAVLAETVRLVDTVAPDRRRRVRRRRAGVGGVTVARRVLEGIGRSRPSRATRSASAPGSRGSRRTGPTRESLLAAARAARRRERRRRPRSRRRSASRAPRGGHRPRRPPD